MSLPPDLMNLLEELRSAGIPIPDDATPFDILAMLLNTREGDSEGPMWEGYPLVIGEDVPIVMIEKKLEDELLPKFREAFESKGQLHPIGFVFARHAPQEPRKKAPESHARHLVIAPQDGCFDVDDKEAFSQALKLLAWKTDAAGVVFASEAWIVESSDLKGIREFSGRLQEHPQRKEIIMVHYEPDRGESATFRAEITRDGDVATLGEWERETRHGQRSGRFTTFLFQNEVRAS